MKFKKKLSIIKIWRLKSVAGQLSDRPEILAGQNENLPVLSDSPAVFTKTGDTSNDIHSPGPVIWGVSP